MTIDNESTKLKNRVLREIIDEIREEKKGGLTFPFWNNWINWNNWMNWANWMNWWT